jgi:N-acetylmuramoyl-L-alanine amidase
MIHTLRFRGLVPIIAAMLLPGCAPVLRVHDRPISFSDERVEMTRAYIESHYGTSPTDIEITPRVVVLHWTAINDLEGSFRAFDRETLTGRPDLSTAGQVNVSIQFLVDRDGAIYRLMPENWMARHVIGLNYSAIGVENVGGEQGVDNLTDAQIEANIQLVRYLEEKYPTIEYLIGHSEYQAFEGHPLWREQNPDYRTTKADPGERFMRAVRAGVADLDLKDPEEIRKELAKPRIVPHSAWGAQPPVGHAADATRRNLAPGDSLQFKDVKVTLRGMMIDSSGERPVDRVILELRRAGDREERTVTEETAFNWGGFHFAVLAVHTREDELGGGLTELEVATIESLSPEIAAATAAGGAEQRLRIPHEIQTITLHHSGSAEPLRPEDDPVQKLRGLQAWGKADKNWWDVPYHFLIDLDGNIYEGRDYRYMGETNTEYNPRGHLLISVLGNYNLQDPTPAQIEAITGLMAWAAMEFDVPLDRIYGHGDHADTSCPGTHLRRYLDDGTFREGVRARLRRGGLQ